MSPTVFRYKNQAFFFFSHEEKRMHIHARSADGEAKFWMEPRVVLCRNYGFSAKEVKKFQEVIGGIAMKSLRRGSNISKVEIQGISNHGIWIYVDGEEYFLSYSSYPWFLNARVEQVYNVEFLFGGQLRWPDLDVDLELDALKHPEKYPWVYDGGSRHGAISRVRETQAKN